MVFCKQSFYRLYSNIICVVFVKKYSMLKFSYYLVMFTTTNGIVLLLFVPLTLMCRRLKACLCDNQVKMSVTLRMYAAHPLRNTRETH